MSRIFYEPDRRISRERYINIEAVEVSPVFRRNSLLARECRNQMLLLTDIIIGAGRSVDELNDRSRTVEGYHFPNPLNFRVILHWRMKWTLRRISPRRRPCRPAIRRLERRVARWLATASKIGAAIRHLKSHSLPTVAPSRVLCRCPRKGSLRNI